MPIIEGHTLREGALLAGIVGLGVATALLLLPAAPTAAAAVLTGEGAPDRIMADLVVLLAAATLGCVWLWTLTAVAVCLREVDMAPAADSGAPGTVLRPRLVRLLVATVVGTAVAAPTAAAADEASLPTALRGLALPDRVADAAAPTEQQPAVLHRVRAGESLWQIARDSLPRATDAEVDRGWRQVYQVNRDVIGPDPDLILPGTSLRLPTNLRLETPGAHR
jgi:hypothetical protein